MSLGHDGPPAEWYTENLITGEPLARCPVRDRLETDPRLVREFDRMMLGYFPHYERGHLLVGGGVSEQPERYLDWMQMIAATKAAAQAKYDEITAPRSEAE